MRRRCLPLTSPNPDHRLPVFFVSPHAPQYNKKFQYLFSLQSSIFPGACDMCCVVTLLGVCVLLVLCCDTTLCVFSWFCAVTLLGVCVFSWFCAVTLLGVCVLLVLCCDTTWCVCVLLVLCCDTTWCVCSLGSVL
ncbi:hypothetical protein J6590_004253 [Homalodisca vitripennis]|nr:hypothetical protein J6590_004253 [Homalodisca vitripennis]